jgi:hypothetical protein
MEKAVQAENQKAQAEQITGDKGSNFHGFVS